MSTAPVSPTSPPLPSKAAGLVTNGAGWARNINRMVLEQRQHASGARPNERRSTDLLAVIDQPNIAPHAALISANAGRFSTAAAELLVRQGMKAPLLTELAASSGIDPKLMYEFAGIDRSTVARKAARQASLPQGAAVKALEFVELVASAADVFGTVPDAARWLTLPHPVLDGETPLQRARTPWGLQRVRAMLVALRYGGVV